MTDLDLTKLRKIAEAANQWTEQVFITSGFTKTDLDVRHIAAFDPPTVLALIDEIERLRRGIKHSADILEPLSKTWLKQNNLELGVPMRYQVELMRELLDQNEAGGSDG